MPRLTDLARRMCAAAAILCAASLFVVARADGLKSTLDRLLTGEGLAGAQVGCMVVDLTTGETLYQRNAAEPLILASNTKLITTAAALDRLGSAHRIETTISRRGIIAGDELFGDLVVHGGGDPTMGLRYHPEAYGPLDRLVRAVLVTGVRRVKGDLVLDDTLFDGELQHTGWPQDQLDRWYAAPASALSLNDGCIDVTVSPGAKPGDPARVRLAPSSSVLEVDVSCRTTANRKEHVISVGRLPGRNRYVVRGKILLGAKPLTVSIAQWQPAVIFGAVLRERLAALGIKVEGRVRKLDKEGADGMTVPGGEQLLAIHSTLLAEIIPVINKRSQNHYAEMVLKRLGALAGEGGSFASGAKVAKRFVTSLGVPDGEVSVADGSGLARGNRLSARGMVRLLRAMASHRESGPYLASFAVGGVDGTLKRRFRGVPGAHRVRAKTGTIRGVSTLSGYVLPEGDQERFLAFSILTNRLRKGSAASRRVQDEVVKALLRFAD